MSDIISRLAGIGALTPELILQMLGMIIDAVGTGEEWAGDNLTQLGQLTEQLADKVRGIKESRG